MLNVSYQCDILNAFSMTTLNYTFTLLIYIGIYCCQDKLFTVKSYTNSAVGKTKITVASHDS